MYLISYPNAAARRSKYRVWNSDFLIHKVRQGLHGRRHDPPEPTVGSNDNNVQEDDNTEHVGTNNNNVQIDTSGGNDTPLVNDDTDGDEASSADTQLSMFLTVIVMICIGVPRNMNHAFELPCGFIPGFWFVMMALLYTVGLPRCTITMIVLWDMMSFPPTRSHHLHPLHRIFLLHFVLHLHLMQRMGRL